MNKDNVTQFSIESECNITNKKDHDSVNINHKNCSYCNKPFIEELWCKECDPRCMIEGWTSGNHDIDKFIKDTIYDARKNYDKDDARFLEWVQFDRFGDIRRIGVCGFAQVYSATCNDEQAENYKLDYESWKKSYPKPIEIALKRLNNSQNMSANYLSELKAHWNLNKSYTNSLKFYGMTKDPETKEFMMIIEFAKIGNLRCFLSSNYKNISWKDKINYLHGLSQDLKYLHKLGYSHKDFHRPSNEQKSDDKICGVLPYIALEVLNGEQYTLSSDIYSFEFGKGTPKIYKKLAYRCMNATFNQRPTAEELYDILNFWWHSSDINSFRYNEYQEKEVFGYKGKEVKVIFDEADKEIPNILISYEKNPDAIYTSRIFTFNNLLNPVNSSIITSYINDEEHNIDFQDSQLIDLEISNSLNLNDDNKDNAEN
ncbi:kinase-like domain-containing protein [Rhizophagus diaphanus]|nr:kinase-like domain-containing protein [Rhizophagus diaphanus] [Rhizophagus sp. MUCL 43196]